MKKIVNKPQQKGTLRARLQSELTQKELAKAKTAYDLIGNIAILEIPPELEKKERLIAKTLLESNKNIKTVVKKAGIHEGIFRTQKMKNLAGEKTTETIHKENNVQLKLDIEKVYFSPRLATERKRIMEQVKPAEEILIMFSGCAPYPCVISKNTKARTVFGIEINPFGHAYGLENVKLNKLYNVVLIGEDVRLAVPNIYRTIIGLKISLDHLQMMKRLKHHPLVHEFHLEEQDLFKNVKILEKAIKHLQKYDVELILHMPFSYKGKKVTLASTDPEDTKEFLFMLHKLGELCRKYRIRAVVHPTQEAGKEDKTVLVENLKKLRKYHDYFFFENLTKGVYANTEDIVKINREAGIRNVCIDLAHLYALYKSNRKILDHIKAMRKEFNTYFHVNDYDGKTHSCEIGNGFIDFEKILPFVNKGVTEVKNIDENAPAEMVHSYLKIGHIQKKFDRIAMPLPKSAEDFLPEALLCAKKGTIIHFYDFLEEKDIPTIAVEKIEKACKKAGMRWKFLKAVKCGQHAPHVFRICIDFKII